MALRVECGNDELNMTPMIDVVFNLLIFFLLGSTYMHEERELDLQLPSVPKAQPLTQAPDDLTIQVLADGGIRLDGTLVPLAELRDRLVAARRNFPDQGVAIRGDANVRYESVAQVVSTCREAEIQNVALQVLQED